MRATRALVAFAVMTAVGAGLSACAKSQADKLAGQLRKAGYTDVSAKADYDSKYNTRKKKTETKLDDYEATAKAGHCSVEVEQDVHSDDYVIETAAGKEVNLRNL